VTLLFNVLMVLIAIIAIIQGGVRHELTGYSFVASANYELAIGRNSTRVVSCNTTATVRTLMALRNADLLVRAGGVLSPRDRPVGEPS
jgi:glyceraldehyde-3-phosphate dehydrogenase (NAD(P)+) (phosphorylating)